MILIKKEKDLEVIDVEIRDLIRALNEVPWIFGTLYSCAGFGRAGKTPRHPNEIPKNDPFGHLPKVEGYVMVAYEKGVEKESGRAFHNIFTKFFDKVIKNVYWTKTLKRPIFSYYLYKPSKMKWKSITKFVEDSLIVSSGIFDTD